MKMNRGDAERFIYSQPHLTVGYAFLLNRVVIARNGLQIDPLQKLDDDKFTIGTLDNDLYPRQLQRLYPKAEIRLFTTRDQVFAAVAKGEIAACYMDEIETKTYLLAAPDKALMLRYIKNDELSDSVALVFPWDSLFLREWVNMFLDKEGYAAMQFGDVMEQFASGSPHKRP